MRRNCSEIVGLVGASFTTKIEHLFLTQCFCFGFGCYFPYVVSISIIPQWLNKHRGLAEVLELLGADSGV